MPNDLTKSKIEELLEEREKIYGPAKPFYHCLSKINAEFIEFTSNHGHIEDSTAELIRMIFLKLLRLSVDPTHLDNYRDVSGYLELAKRIELREEDEPGKEDES